MNGIDIYPGPSLIIGYSPCEMHSIKGGMANCQDEMKKAVDCGYWNLQMCIRDSHEHKAGQVVLDVAHSLPVAGLRRAPLLHVARRVEVRESRHGAVRTCEVCAVHAYLVAGEQLQRMPRILVLQQQPAERHVVPRGVLHALQHAVLAQAHEHRGVELRVHAYGQVVGEKWQVGVLSLIHISTPASARSRISGRTTTSR